jgi:hypothetical protein
MLGLCWIHDGRLYKKLNPILNKNKAILDNFLKQYWHFYHQVRMYKETPTAIVKEALYTAFDRLFSTHTAYEKLAPIKQGNTLMRMVGVPSRREC